jgi:hypothetical protein
MPEPVIHRVDVPEAGALIYTDCALVGWTLVGTTQAARVTCADCQAESPWLYKAANHV